MNDCRVHYVERPPNPVLGPGAIGLWLILKIIIIIRRTSVRDDDERLPRCFHNVRINITICIPYGFLLVFATQHRMTRVSGALHQKPPSNHPSNRYLYKREIRKKKNFKLFRFVFYNSCLPFYRPLSLSTSSPSVNPRTLKSSIQSFCRRFRRIRGNFSISFPQCDLVNKPSYFPSHSLCPVDFSASQFQPYLCQVNRTIPLILFVFIIFSGKSLLKPTIVYI